MKQNPRQLINDIHDRISEDDSQRKILSGYSEDPTIWGYSKVWLFVMLLPAMLMFRVSANRLTGTAQLYGFGATVVLAALGIVATVASPGDMDAREYFEAIVSQRAHQQEMIHDSDPDESALLKMDDGAGIESVPRRVAKDISGSNYRTICRCYRNFVSRISNCGYPTPVLTGKSTARAAFRECYH